jgi:hypothetical protein
MQNVAKHYLKYFGILFLGVTYLTVFIPNFFIKWMLIDDGHTIEVVQSINSKVINFDVAGLINIFAESSGRFRPVYWLYNYFVWLVGGSNPVLHRAFHVLIFALIAYFIFRFVLSFTRSKVTSSIASLLFILTPLNYENWMRIGPQEPLVALFSLLTFYYLLKSDTKKSFVFFLLTLLSKETSIAIIPGVIFIYIFRKYFFKKQINDFGKYLIAVLSVTIFFILFSVLIRKGYSSNYVLDISLVKNLVSYLRMIIRGFDPLFQISIFSYLLMIYYQMKSKKKSREFIGSTLTLLISGSFILIQLPWEYVLERYLLPADTYISIFIAIQLFYIYNLLNTVLANRKRLLVASNLLIGLYFLNFFLVSTYLLLQRTIDSVYATDSIRRLDQNISRNLEKNGTILVNMTQGEHSIEYVAEVRLHQDVFWNRSDIKSAYLEMDKLPEGNFVIVTRNDKLSAYPNYQLDKKYSEKYIINSVSEIPVVTTPTNLVKQILKKTYRFVTDGEKFTSDGIYTTYRADNSWYLYYK